MCAALINPPHFVDGRAAVYPIRGQPQRILQTLQHVYSPPGCSTSFSVNPLTAQDDTFQDIVDIQRKQTELSQIMVSQQARSLPTSSEPPMFYGDAMEFPAFMTAFESLIESKFVASSACSWTNCENSSKFGLLPFALLVLLFLSVHLLRRCLGWSKEQG